MSVENEPEPPADAEGQAPPQGAGPKSFRARLAENDTAKARRKAEFNLSRAWGLLRDPRAEWEQIRAEETNVPSILLGYVLPLAAIIPICSVLGATVFGERIGEATVRTDFGRTLVGAVVTFAAIIALVYFIGILINAIAENFDAERDDLSAQKVAAYSMTPFLLSGVFWLWPPLWWATLLGVGATAFLFYRGLPPLMKASPERAMGYAATIMIAGLVAFIILFALAGCVTQVGRI
ncbi:MAG: Yip1 family protein [Hyphomonadaceae bacterium]